VPLGTGVGDAEFEEALDLGPPPFDGGGQARRLDGGGDGAGGEEAGQPVSGLVPAVARRAVGLQELAWELFYRSGRTELAGAVVAGQHRLEPGQRLGAERVASA
jgi:hypothetical protein